MDTRELAWCAGFIDGEGHFGRNGNTPILIVANTVEEPLLHLRRVLSVGLMRGPFSKGEGKNGPNKLAWTWQVNGFERVQYVAAAIWPWLHVKQPQATAVLIAARAQSRRSLRPEGWVPGGTHCAQGHEFTPENTYVWNGSRACRLCAAARVKESRTNGCTHPSCSKVPMTNGLCASHYEEWNLLRGNQCTFPNCPRGQIAKGLCQKHYTRLRQYGPEGPVRPAPALRTHCPKNHEYTPENTYVNPRGSRICKTCSREAKLRWQHTRTEPKQGSP